MSHKLVSLYIGDGEYYTRIDADNYIGELKKERDWLAKDRAQAYDDLEKRAQLNIKQEESIRHQKSCIAELEKENAELKEAQRWRKSSEEKPPKYTWCLVSGKSQMGNYIVITDFFEEDDWVENPNLDDDALDIEWWMPLPSAPKEDK